MSLKNTNVSGVMKKLGLAQGDRCPALTLTFNSTSTIDIGSRGMHVIRDTPPSDDTNVCKVSSGYLK